MKIQTTWVVIIKRKDGELINGMFETVSHVHLTQAEAIQEFIKQETKHGEFHDLSIEQQDRNPATGAVVKVVSVQ